MSGLKKEDIEKYLKENNIVDLDSDEDWDVEEYDDDDDYEDEAPTRSLVRGANTQPYTTSVLLGYLDEEVDADDETSGPTIDDNLLGGRPVWLSKDQQPPKKYMTCDECKKVMPLLVQLSAPLEGTFYDRVLYVFVCGSPGCRRKSGAAKCVRGVRRDAKLEAEREQAAFTEDEKAARAAKEEKERAEAEKEKQRVKGEDLFGGAAASSNPFGGNPFGGNPFSSNPFGASSPFETKEKEKDNSVAENNSSAAKKPTWAQIASKPATPASTSSETDTKKTEETKDPITAGAKEPVTEETKETTKEQAHKEDADYETCELPTFSSGYYLYVENETLDPKAGDKANKSITSSLSPADLKKLLISDEEEEPETSKGKGKSGSHKSTITPMEEATNQALKSQDAAFQKFVEIVGQNPEQIVRYYRTSPKGKSDDTHSHPLLYSARDSVARMVLPEHGGVPSIPVDPVSREPRAVEVQIMPYAISVLEESFDAKQILDNGMEWGTIFVATPLVDPTVKQLGPSGVGYFQDWVGVQWEQ